MPSQVNGSVIAKLSRIVPRLKREFKIAKTAMRLWRYDIRNRLRSSADENGQSHAPVAFYPVCFACAAHFEILKIAVRSLSIWAPSVKEINIFHDKADPLSSSQCEQLRSESRYPMQFRKTAYPMFPIGLPVIFSELYAFRKVAEQMRPNDFLLKFDSDVIFLSDDIFKFVSRGGAQAVGVRVADLHPAVQDEYMQGGSYFIAGSVLRAMLRSKVTETTLALIRKHSPLYEDQFISPMLRKVGVKIVYRKFMHYDPALSEPGLGAAELDARLKAIPPSMSVIHFEGNKSNMAPAAAKLFQSFPA